MNNAALQIKVKERLNKLDSQDYVNMEPWQILEAFNKAQLQWARQIVGSLGKKTPGASDEASKQYIDDMEGLLHLLPMKTKLVDNTFEEASLPADYLAMKAPLAKATNACCGKRLLQLYPCEIADVSKWLRDTSKKPSFDWAETFFTLSAGKLQIYTNAEFDLQDVQLRYYREPRRVMIEGVLDLETKTMSTTEVTCEFRNAVCELLVDKTVGILAGDTENITQYQRAEAEVSANS